jgi:hypothetical protein
MGEMSENEQDQRVSIDRAKMVDEMFGWLGPDGTLALYEFMLKTASQDRLDAAIFRNVKEAYLKAADGKIASLIVGYLKSWEKDPDSPQLDKFMDAMQEKIFIRAQRCADMLEGLNEPARKKVMDAIGTLRSLFAGELVQFKKSDFNIN